MSKAGSVRNQVLRAARQFRSRGQHEFTPADIVRALPHLNAGTVRTHIISRCCVDAPPNHLHRPPDFRRVGRGVYALSE